MVIESKTNKNFNTLYECPICKKTYKTLGWFKRHSKAKHGGVLPYNKKIVIQERDLQTIIMDTMKQVLKEMDFTPNKNTDWERAKEDHEKRIKQASNSKNGNIEDYKNCMTELKNYFENSVM